jgi:hypothetical protein
MGHGICKIDGCERPIFIEKWMLCTLHYGRMMYKRHAQRRRSEKQTLYNQDPEKFRTKSKIWRAENRTESRTRTVRWRKKNPIYVTVTNHYNSIRAGKNPTYRDMIFFTGWDPKQGGSFADGTKWIQDNIGLRPSRTHHLHIVDRRLGFVPGNLAWVPRDKHQQQEMIPRLLLEIQNLHAELETFRRPTSV